MSEQPPSVRPDAARPGGLAAMLRDPQLWVPVVVLVLGLLVLLWIA